MDSMECLPMWPLDLCAGALMQGRTKLLPVTINAPVGACAVVTMHGVEASQLSAQAAEYTLHHPSAPPPPGRDLSSPFVCDLESLLESINPDYCRSSKQHNPPAWTHSLTDGGWQPRCTADGRRRKQHACIRLLSLCPCNCSTSSKASLMTAIFGNASD